MFGVELIALAIGLGGIALAYFFLNHFLREKTFEEALAEQRGGSARASYASDASNKASKDKSRIKKAKPQQNDAGSDGEQPRLAAATEKLRVNQVHAEVKTTTKGKQQQQQQSQKGKVQASGTDGESSANEAAPVPVKRQEKTTEASKSKVASPQPQQLAKEKSVEKKKKTSSKRTDKSESENDENASLANKASHMLDTVAAATAAQGKVLKERGGQVLSDVTATLSAESHHLMEQAEHVASNVATAVSEQGKVLMEKAQHLMESMPRPSEAMAAVTTAGKAGGKDKKKTAKKSETSVNTVNEQQTDNGPKDLNKQEGTQRRKEKTASTSESTSRKEVLFAASPAATGSEYSEVLGLLRNVNLSDEQTQGLLHVLIVKQSERHSEWVQLGKSKTVDPATLARRLIEGKEKDLIEEKGLNRVLSEQLKDLKGLLNQERLQSRQLTEAQKSLAEKVPTLENQVRTLTLRLKEVQDKHAADVNQFTQRLKESESQSRLASSESSDQLTRVRDDAEDMTSELASCRTEKERLMRDLQTGYIKIQQLEEQVQHLTQQNKMQLLETETHVRSSEEDIGNELEEMKAALETMRSQLQESRDRERHAAHERETIDKKLSDLNSALSKRDAEIQELVQQVENFQTENSEMKQMNEKLTQSITALQEARGSQEQYNQEEAHLREEVLKLTSSVEDFKQKEEEAKSKVDQVRSEALQDAQERYESRFAELQGKHRDVLNRLFPSIHVDHSLNADEWLSHFETQVKQSIRKDDAQTHRVEQLEKELADSKSQAEHLRKSLAETEKKLHELQASIESEEEKWELVDRSAKDYEHKCRTLETQLSQLAEEKNHSHRLLEERQSSVSAMEHRLKEAEERLQSVSSIEESLNQLRRDADTLKGDLGLARREKDHLSEELTNTKRSLEESQNSKREVDHQLAAVLQEINELKNKSQNLDQLHQDAQGLRSALDGEKENARKMAQELLRQRGLISFGLDSLKKEEEVVHRLREALNDQEQLLRRGNGEMNGQAGGDHMSDHSGRRSPHFENDHPHSPQGSYAP
ncbi:hypothetical protein RvY_08718-2 [Ramazzottius varieornatus]|uniref:Ribosome receptor lysine/proline rich domain-containing protein n=1 Tax=Ramazzottius varieornatus TaxID=947166 RepID=A0A1D1V6Y3_RAMVA|nr:hypothetical protein RvY_08718-2 [Ramazzottius varieornatus]